MKTYIKPVMEIYMAETADTFMLSGSDGNGQQVVGNGGGTSVIDNPGGGGIVGQSKLREMEEAIEDIW